MQRFTRPWYRFTGGDGGAPNPVADGISDSAPAATTPGTADQTDEPGLSQEFHPSQPPETAGPASPEDPATVAHSLPLLVAQTQASVAQRAPMAMSRPAAQEPMHPHAAAPQLIGLAPPFRPAVGPNLAMPVPVEGSAELPGAPTVVPALIEPPGTLQTGPQTLTESGNETWPAGPTLDRQPVQEPIWSQSGRPSSRNLPCPPRANRGTFQARRAGRVPRRSPVGCEVQRRTPDPVHEPAFVSPTEPVLSTPARLAQRSSGNDHFACGSALRSTRHLSRRLKASEEAQLRPPIPPPLIDRRRQPWLLTGRPQRLPSPLLKSHGYLLSGPTFKGQQKSRTVRPQPWAILHQQTSATARSLRTSFRGSIPEWMTFHTYLGKMTPWCTKASHRRRLKRFGRRTSRRYLGRRAPACLRPMTTSTPIPRS